MRTLTYDLETTGLPHRSVPPQHPLQPRVMQLGAILDDDDGKELARIDIIIKHHDLPDETIKSLLSASKIHGVTKEISDLVGITEVTAFDAFLDLLDAAELVVGQNITGFDNAIVTGTVRRLHQMDNLNPFEGKPIFDTMLEAQTVCRIPARNGGWKRPNLTEIHTKLFNEGFADAHTAIADVLACRRCYYELKRLAGEKK